MLAFVGTLGFWPLSRALANRSRRRVVEPIFRNGDATIGRVVNEAVQTDLAGSLSAEAYAALYVTGTADHAEAVAAFAEKRPPDFRRFR